MKKWFCLVLFLCSFPAVSQERALYFSLAPFTEGARPLSNDLHQKAHERIVQVLSQRGSLVEESRARPNARAKKAAKAYRLKVRLTPVENGMEMNVVCFTYPQGQLLGEVNLTAEGPNAAQLVDALVPRAIEEAAATFEWDRA